MSLAIHGVACAAMVMVAAPFAAVPTGLARSPSAAFTARPELLPEAPRLPRHRERAPASELPHALLNKLEELPVCAPPMPARSSGAMFESAAGTLDPEQLLRALEAAAKRDSAARLEEPSTAEARRARGEREPNEGLAASIPKPAVEELPETRASLERPRLLSRLKLKRPARCASRGHHGLVRLRLEIDVIGRVAGARVVASAGCEALDEAARTAFAGARFAPARRGGVAVACVELVEALYER